MVESLRAYVQRLRTERGLTQKELAEEAGVNQPLVSDIERGATKLPDADRRRRLAKALRVRHVDLLVAAGELTEDEIDPYAPQYLDPTIDALSQIWPFLGEERQESLIRMVNYLLEPVSSARIILPKSDEGEPVDAASS